MPGLRSPWRPATVRRALRHGLGDGLYAFVFVLAASLLTLWLEPMLPAPPPVGITLFAVMVVAVTRGVVSAILAAVLGWLSYNFFLEEPRFVLQFNSSRDVYIFAIFASVGVFTGALAERLRQERRTAKLKAQQLDFLLRASQRFSTIIDQGALCEAVVQLMAESGCVDPHLYVQAPSIMSARGDHHPPERLGQWLLDSRSPESLVDGDWTGRLLSAAGRPLGWAAWRSQHDAELPTDRTDLKVLLDMAASALIRISQTAEKVASA